MICKFCQKELTHKILDLGAQPLANGYLTENTRNQPQKYLPLVVWICDICWLAQCEQFASKEKIFDEEYAYFSSSSASWLKHAKEFALKVIDNFTLDENSFVIEIASNDGYLLQNFQDKSINCLGVEPTKSTSNVAIERGVRTIQKFFGTEIVPEIIANYQKADLIICNNVLAHVPNLRDFVQGLKEILKTEGLVTLEFPHLQELVQGNKFDTVYHEHFSYFSLIAAKNIFNHFNLRIFDVEKLKTHGGSYRLFVCHSESQRTISTNMETVLKEEAQFGVNKIKFYQNFQFEAERVKYNFLKFLLDAKFENKKVVAYGAAAKGNTLLNFAGVKKDLIDFVCDTATSKQGKFLPGSQIPIMPPEYIFSENPDYVVVFPWNLIDEIKRYLHPLILNGTKIVTAVPNLKIH